jgi:DNA polymerase-3 subunit epsilon
MSLKQIILDSVSHECLKKMSNSLDVQPKDLRSSASIRQAIKSWPNLTGQDLINHLNVGELKMLCSLCEIPARGRRAELIRVLQERHEQPSKSRSGNLKTARPNGADHFVAIDFETADHPRDSACAVALVRVHGSEIVARSEFLIRPPRNSFLSRHVEVHGITWAKVQSAQTFEEIWPEILPKIEGAKFLVAHNASFDRSVLEACCKAYGLTLPVRPFECTVKWARQVWNLRPTGLPDVCGSLGIPLIHHEPLSDAEACARIMIKIRQEIAGNQ